MNASSKPVEIDPKFDPKFLDVYTGGDNIIRDQVLVLFLEQADILMKRLEDARGDAPAWHMAAHSLKGCAAGVGAAGIAEIARAAERVKDAEEAQLGVLNELHAAVTATAIKVREVLAG